MLNQLGRKSISFLDLCAHAPAPAKPNVVMVNLFGSGLIGLRGGPAGPRWLPNLDAAGPGRLVPFDQWWTEPVYEKPGEITDGRSGALHMRMPLPAARREALSRKDLVLTTYEGRVGYQSCNGSTLTGRSQVWITRIQ